MKFNPIFQQYLNCGNEPEVFQHFQDTLTDSITLWNEVQPGIIKLLWCGHLACKMCTSYLCKLLYMQPYKEMVLGFIRPEYRQFTDFSVA